MKQIVSVFILLRILLIVLNHLGNNFLDGTVDDVVGDGVDGSVGVVVDRDNDTRLLHTGDVLDLAGDTASDIYLWTNGDTRLTNLTVVIDETGIDGSTAGAYLGMDLLGQVEEHIEVLLRAHAVTTGNDDGSTLEVVLGFLDVTVEDAHHVFGFGNIFGYIMTDYFALVVLIEYLFLHHTFAHGSHLWTMLGVDNGGNNVSTKGRTNLIELVLVMLGDGLLVLIEAYIHVKLADLEFGAVGGEAAEEGRRNARAEVAAYYVGTHQADLGILFLEEVDENGGVGIGSVGEETWSVEDVYAVNTILHHLVLDTIEARAGADTLQLYAKSIGELATFGQEFEADVLDGLAFDFAIYKYAVHF